MFSKTTQSILAVLILGITLLVPRGFCDYNYDPSKPDTPDPRALALKPTILKLNKLVVAEIEKGIAALEQKDIPTAVQSFITATQIEPYDPMAYILLIKIFINAGEEHLAYKWLMLSGRNLSDSNQIIGSLYAFLKEAHLPIPETDIHSPVLIAPFKDNKQCAVSFTFDDGEPSVATDILPLFEQYGYQTTVAINPGNTFEGKENVSRGTWDDWRKAAAHGHEIANHGAHHKPLPGLSPEELKTEVIDSFETIRQKIGHPPQSFIFPEDKSNPELVDFAETKHVMARDFDSLSQVYKNICIPIYGGKRFSIQTARMMIDIAIDRRLWLIPQCHGLYSPSIKKSFKAIHKELLVDQLEYLKKNSEKVWVDRFIDVYKYLKERTATRIEVRKKTDHGVEFSLTNSLDPAIYDQPLTVLINTFSASPVGNIKVTDTTTSRPIPFTFNNAQILINIPADGHVIRVEWH